jgi:hypothetical protein
MLFCERSVLEKTETPKSANVAFLHRETVSQLINNNPPIVPVFR